MATRDRSRRGNAPASSPPPSRLSAEVERLRAHDESLRLENEHLIETLHLVEEAHAEQTEIYDFAPLPLFTLDRAGTIRHVNLAGADLLGHQRSRLLGRSLWSFVAPCDREVLARYLALWRSGQERGTCELHLAPPGQLSFVAQLSTRLSSRANGLLQVGVLDLRERDQALEEVRRLVAAERAARKESDAKDKFIAMLSHELRTPLTPVLAASSLMCSREDIPSDVSATFEMIRRNVAMEARIIDDLLDVTRIARGKMSVEFRPTDVHRVALEAVEILNPEALRKQQAIQVELGAQRQHANADPARLRQVFWNLLNNAIKFTPPGGEIHLRSWNTGALLTIEVEDSGIGIATEALSTIFEPFEQLDDQRANRGAGGGLGLGLAISKGLVELHGGRIAASSRGRDQGARFVVQLATLARLSARESQKRQSHEPRGAAAMGSEGLPAAAAAGRRPRILLVEDHPDTVAVMTELLVHSGYDVESVQSVQSALAIDLGQVDVIVSDIGLPDGTGLELMRELQAKERRPAIALSGFGMEADIKASKEAGFDFHLTKPVDVEKLLGVIRTLNAARRASPIE